MGSALVGLLGFAGFAVICLAAGEDAVLSVVVGLFLGLGIWSALALTHLVSRGHARRYSGASSDAGSPGPGPSQQPPRAGASPEERVDGDLDPADSQR
jgi:hypothetical protein